MSNLIDELLSEVPAPPTNYYYGMRLREIGIGCQPAGHFDYRSTSKSQTGYYGILTYQRELTAEETARYELTPVTPNEYIALFARNSVDGIIEPGRVIGHLEMPVRLLRF